MIKLKKIFMFLVLIAIFLFQIPKTVLANNYDYELNNLQKNNIDNKHSNIVELANIQKRLDEIKEQISETHNENQFIKLNESALQLFKDTDILNVFLIYKFQKTINQLKILGIPPKIENAIKETLQITNKRNKLNKQKIKLNQQIKQINIIKKNVLIILKQIETLKKEQIKNQLTFNSGSIFSLKFWIPLITSYKLDQIKIINFFHNLRKIILFSWSQKFRFESIFWLILSIIIPIFGRKFIKKFLIYFGIKNFFEKELQYNFFILINSFAKATIITLTLNCIYLSFARYSQNYIDIKIFIDNFFKIVIFYSLFYGLLNSFFLCNTLCRPLTIINNISKIFKSFIFIFIWLIFIFQIIEVFNYSIINNNDKIIFFNGITAFLISSALLFFGIYINNIKYKINVFEKKLINYSILTGIIKIFLILSGITILFLLSTGYIILGRFISHEILFCSIIFYIFYFIKSLLNNYLNYFFLKKDIIYQNVQNLLNINERHFQQFCVLLIALIKIVILIFIIKLIFNSTFISSIPIIFSQKITKFLSNQGLGPINIILQNLINVSLCLVISIFLLRIIRNWLEYDFFPKTNIDNGIRISLLILFNNIGYVVIILIIFLLLGVKWNKLAWIVSALSVGIGFGLQEIVKNFISGIILLTERPIKVGDLISIDGIEGNIKHIKIRATEIQLEDKSTLIVPNSQFISQKVRNVTMNNPPGIIKILLTLPLNVDLIKIKDILLKIYNKNCNILKKPEPYVSFLDLTTKGVIISVIGRINNYRQISIVKSDLIFSILNNLRKENILFNILK